MYNPATGVRMQCTPTRPLMDDTVNLVIQGLRPRQRVTILAEMMEGKQLLYSYGFYVADEDGSVSNNTSVAVGGCYQGVEPNGLFWSMRGVGHEKHTYRLRIKDVTAPLETRLSVYNGHVSDDIIPKPNDSPLKHLLNPPNLIAKCTIHRLFIADHVRRVPVRVGRIRGTLFLPNNGSTVNPGVIDLYGTAGGLEEHRAALLASRGFTVLALAYFLHDDLQDTFSPLDLSYFVEAIDWLAAHPNCSPEPGGVGVIGISLGAVIACYLSIISPKVRAVVSVGGHYALVNTDLYYGDRHFPIAIPDFNKAIIDENGEQSYKVVFSDVEDIENHQIPLEEAEDTQFMFIHGTDDENITSSASLRLAGRLESHGHSNYKLHLYPGAGHLIEPPYTPFCRATFHRVLGSVDKFGGSLRAHAYAQEDHWRQVLQFMTSNLCAHQYYTTSAAAASTGGIHDKVLLSKKWITKSRL